MRVLKVEYKNYCCQATIQRPDALNAINFAVMDELEALLGDLESNNRTRCFILTGSGTKSFISGGDLWEFHTIKTAKEVRPMAQRMLSILERIEMLPCWTIASINGPAYGGGCEIMLAFDFRIASDQATFGFTQGKFYLPPGWGGLTRLVECVGRSTALLWLAEAAIVDAKTAQEYKLVNAIEPPDKLETNVFARAKKLCYNDRDYIHAIKKGAFKLAEARWKSIHQELASFGSFWEDERHHQRVSTFLERKNEH